MNKEKYNQIMMEAYRQYSEKSARKLFKSNTYQEFINKCKMDNEFSERWGIQIEERELSFEERLELWYQKNQSETGKRGIWEIDYIENYEGHKKLNSYNIPTKLITITYNNETIESYE